MNLVRIEDWNGHKIRFVWKDGEWWAVAVDVARALGYSHTPHMTRRLDDDEKDAVRLTDTIGRKQRMNIISETGVYEAVFGSGLKEAKDFRRWVKQTLKQLRQSTGLEGFQVFRMLDKEHQKETMKRLCSGLHNPVRVDFIKANTIANKAVSNAYGFPKMIKKGEMTPDMLVKRQSILEDTVDLMTVKEKYGLGISVAQAIYSKCNTSIN